MLNLTQNIENGFKNKQITGVEIVDPSAAYDTINYSIMLTKLYEMTHDHNIVKIIEALLSNLRFFDTLNGKNSRRRNSKNNLRQGNVLAPTLFIINTNDQPISNDKNIKYYIYEDDSAIIIQDNSFETIARKLSDTLAKMDEYFEVNSLRLNPLKIEVCAFHLRNKEANQKLHVTWKVVELVNSPNPKYLFVVLDRSLTCKVHCEKTKMKINKRNGLLRKLVGSAWVVEPHALSVKTLRLCFSTSNFESPVWGRSGYTIKIDTTLNETCRLITGCLKNTAVNKLYTPSGIDPPEIRRSVQDDPSEQK